jgi:transcriptional regulator with XRE-family HTH domain
MTTEENRQVRRRPGRRAPLDLYKLNAAVRAWQAADPHRHSLRKLAELTGYSVAHVDGVLLGKHGLSPKALRQIAVEIGVPVESVMTDDAA